MVYLCFYSRSERGMQTVAGLFDLMLTLSPPLRGLDGACLSVPGVKPPRHHHHHHHNHNQTQNQQHTRRRGRARGGSEEAEEDGEEEAATAAEAGAPSLAVCESPPSLLLVAATPLLAFHVQTPQLRVAARPLVAGADRAGAGPALPVQLPLLLHVGLHAASTHGLARRYAPLEVSLKRRFPVTSRFPVTRT